MNGTKDSWQKQAGRRMKIQKGTLVYNPAYKGYGIITKEPSSDDWNPGGYYSIFWLHDLQSRDHHSKWVRTSSYLKVLA
jgi:hypothetical protein